ncbi:hypothetical protein OG921_26255 [Aldersonia sp. NBC_00410]|uniref:hypothetical protein n=1 Tax=Aldersonia sp. NBC_00410 TaxID=2975954 RepID=UPI00225274CE|nr:hypothetical protein [Aldersonia sp. NBC_00410]MCX5046682.1 hypothetical protein [Aldersonia sp. NBC_00410]
MSIIAGDSVPVPLCGVSVAGVSDGIAVLRARDAVGQVLREQAVGLPGAQRDWALVSDSRRESWRVGADPLVGAIVTSGVDLVSSHGPDSVDPTGCEHWVAGGHDVAFEPDPVRPSVRFDGVAIAAAELLALVEAGVSALRELRASAAAGVSA